MESHSLDITALVVDDHLESILLIEVILEPWGVSIVSAASAAEAESMIQAIQPDVILCDLVMPGLDRLTFIRRLRTHGDPRIRNIPAVAITAMYEDISARIARDAGFDVYIRKPIDAEQLPHTIALLVEGRPDAGAAGPAAH
jgi:two-component system, OmpR family, response regulator